MASIIKKMLKMAPLKEAGEGYSPSPMALKLATKSKTDYDGTDYHNAYSGDLKILMVCTDQRYMTMQNGTKFSTGNHPVEMLVPMLHFAKAGFDIDICTPTGKPAAIEMWAFPEDDDAVVGIYKQYQAAFEAPMSLKDIVQGAADSELPYAAVFIPGGHGAMLGLPENGDLGKLIHWVIEHDKYMLSICHGPAALIAAHSNNQDDSFVYAGYKMAVFPDSVDKLTPTFGYMPGHMPWYFGEKLKALGVEIVNKKANGTCHHDRKLVTGDSPNAANAFGKMATHALLKTMT